jgi:acyl-CoA synthetase (AMP-forming)/AMP-acid ligase II
LPVFFGHGLIGNVLTPLLAGGRVHLWQGPDMAALAGLGALLDARAISFMSSVPSFWKLALRISARPQRVLDRIHVGSAPLSIEQWRDIAAWAGTRAVYNMLGMTETANWIGGGSLDEADGADGYVGSCWGGALAVLGEDGRVARSGRGEVLVQSPSLMLGYWQRPDLDAAAFVDGWFRTGDVGALSETGHLTLVGRLKSEINRGGIKIQAEEIDMLLERHPEIIEACAFGIPDAMAGEAVAAAIVLRPGARFDPDAIKAWCRERVRAEAVPGRLYKLEAIPRNDRGKVVRADVRTAAEGKD